MVQFSSSCNFFSSLRPHQKKKKKKKEEENSSLELKIKLSLYHLKTKESWACSRDVAAAMLVFQHSETAAMLVSQTNSVGVEFFSHVMLC